MDTINENLTTEARVMKAIEQIITRKEKVTNNAVKLELGGGSFSTISPFLKKWRESQRQTTTVITVPEKIREMIFHHGGLLYQTLKADSMEDYENLKSQYKADIEDLEGENAEQAMELSRLEEKLSEALEYGHTAMSDAESYSTSLHQINIQLASELAKRESAETLVIEYKGNWHASRLSEDTYRTEAVSLALASTNHAHTIDLLKHDTEEMKIQLEYLSADKNRLVEKGEVLKQENRELIKSLDREQQEVVKLKAMVADQDKTLHKLQASVKDLDAIRQSLTKCQTELDGSKSRIRELVTETGGLKQENKELVKLNGKLEAQVEQPVATRK